jgi:hypothetical protein
MNGILVPRFRKIHTLYTFLDLVFTRHVLDGIMGPTRKLISVVYVRGVGRRATAGFLQEDQDDTQPTTGPLYPGLLPLAFRLF